MAQGITLPRSRHGAQGTDHRRSFHWGEGRYSTASTMDRGRCKGGLAGNDNACGSNPSPGRSPAPGPDPKPGSFMWYSALRWVSSASLWVSWDVTSNGDKAGAVPRRSSGMCRRRSGIWNTKQAYVSSREQDRVCHNVGRGHDGCGGHNVTRGHDSYGEHRVWGASWWGTSVSRASFSACMERK